MNRRNDFVTLAALLATGFSAEVRAQVQPPVPPRSDSAFYTLARGLATDSLWVGKATPGVSYYATNTLTLSFLRAVAVPADSVPGSANIVCPGPATNAARAGASGARAQEVARSGYVLSFNMVAGDSANTYSVYLSAGCRPAMASGTAPPPPTGHSCGWQLGRRGAVWRIMRSLGCSFI